MSTHGPIYCEYMGDGEFKAIARQQKRCDAEFVVGKIYPLEELDELPTGRDRAYHAEMRNLWLNLPHEYDGQFPSYDAFRHWCLIRCGFSSITRLPCPSEKFAQQLLPHIIPSDGGIVHLEGAVIVIAKPLSQKISERRGGMPKEQRLNSYNETLDYARSLVGVSVDESRNIAEATA